jgi:hypothetical protein
MTDQPLQAWRCDTCGELITDPAEGLVVWRTDDGHRGYDYLVVHQSRSGRRCDPEAQRGYIANLPLSSFLGPDGAAMMLGWLSYGPIKNNPGNVRVKDFDQYVDLFRRVQTPGYEEARPYFNAESTHHWFGDANEYRPYMLDALQRIVREAENG